MRRPRKVCPKCGSVAVAVVDQRSGMSKCQSCGYTARKFPLSTDPVPSADQWDGRPRVDGRVLPIRDEEG